MPAPKTNGKRVHLSIALEKTQRDIVDSAANALHLPPSVWAKSVLLSEAEKVIGRGSAKAKP